MFMSGAHESLDATTFVNLDIEDLPEISGKIFLSLFFNCGKLGISSVCSISRALNFVEILSKFLHSQMLHMN